MGKVNIPWFKEKPELLAEIQELIKTTYPTLHVIVGEMSVGIRGSLFLHDLDTKQEIDRYTIEVELLTDYPKSIPLVREAGGRIPRITDRHINDNGTACLFVPDERWKHYPESASIVDFIGGPVYQFFLGQSYFEITGKWLFGQRSHGTKGLFEYYAEVLETKDAKIIYDFVSYLSKNQIKGHWPCYCKSGKRLRHCHLDKVREYRSKISIEAADESLKNLGQETFGK